jgi:hypothetical protein
LLSELSGIDSVLALITLMVPNSPAFDAAFARVAPINKIPRRIVAYRFILKTTFLASPYAIDCDLGETTVKRKTHVAPDASSGQVQRRLALLAPRSEACGVYVIRRRPSPLLRRLLQRGGYVQHRFV